MSTFSSSDILTNLSHLLPTGTFLLFQTLAPLFTNNGNCHRTEKIVTGVLLGLFFAACFGVSFTDSITTDEGVVYYGIVTRWGLYNPKFKTLVLKDSKLQDVKDGNSYYGAKDDGHRYSPKLGDFVNGALNVVVFGVVSCLTPPISTCYYPRISQTLVKTGPILAGLLVGALFALFPSGRHGLGYATTTDKTVGAVSGHGDTPPTPGDFEVGPKGITVE